MLDWDWIPFFLPGSAAAAGGSSWSGRYPCDKDTLLPELFQTSCSVLFDHFAVAVDGEGSTAGGKGDAAVVAAGLLAGFLGSLQCFLNGMTVVRGHARKDRRSYGQSSAHPGVKTKPEALS